MRRPAKAVTKGGARVGESKPPARQRPTALQQSMGVAARARSPVPSSTGAYQPGCAICASAAGAANGLPPWTGWGGPTAHPGGGGGQGRPWREYSRLASRRPHQLRRRCLHRRRAAAMVPVAPAARVNGRREPPLGQTGLPAPVVSTSPGVSVAEVRRRGVATRGGSPRHSLRGGRAPRKWGYPPRGGGKAVVFHDSHHTWSKLPHGADGRHCNPTLRQCSVATNETGGGRRPHAQGRVTRRRANSATFPRGVTVISDG